MIELEILDYCYKGKCCPLTLNRYPCWCVIMLAMPPDHYFLMNVKFQSEGSILTTSVKRVGGNILFTFQKLGKMHLF